MEQWIEVEDCYITNQPLIFASMGKGREKVPDPDKPPTQAYLICYHCKGLKSGRIQRRRFMKSLEVESASLLDPAIVEYISNLDVKLIQQVDNPNKFISEGLPAVDLLSDYEPDPSVEAPEFEGWGEG